MRIKTLLVLAFIALLGVASTNVRINVWYCGPATGGCPQSDQEYFSPDYLDFDSMILTAQDGKIMSKYNFGTTYWGCQAGGGTIYPGYRATVIDGNYWSYARLNSSCSRINTVTVTEILE